jgi:flagellar motor switch/type III secretory pathway protein FliN
MDIKVTGYGAIKSSTPARKTGGGSSVSFSSLLSGTQSSSATAQAAEINATTAISNLFALQEISEEERKRERALKHGKTMLDALERLRQQLLMGEIPSHMLADLSLTLEEQKQTLSDPHLMALIEDIELRVAVELAKLEMAFAAKAGEI